MHAIHSKFISRGLVQHGDWVVYPKNIALELILECKKENVPILGVDAFLLGKDIHHPDFPEEIYTPNAMQPSMAHSVDFTAQGADVQDRYESATNLIKNCDDKYYFEIVCG